MTLKTSNYMQKTAHIFLIIISVAFTTRFFFQFSDELLGKILWGMFAISLEIIKLYLFLQIKRKIKKEKSFFKYITSTFLFVVFLGLVATSGVCTLSYVLYSLENKNFVSKVNTLDRDNLLKDLDVINEQIQNKLRQQKELPTDYITASQRLTSQIEALNREKEKLIKQINEINTTQNDYVTINDSFTLLGRLINKSGRDTYFYIMLMMVVLLEISLILTSGEIEESSIEEDFNANVQKYIDYMFLDVKGKRLNNNEFISKKANISLRECERIKDFLLQITYNNIPILKSGRGGTVSNFTKEQIKKIVNYRLENVRRTH